MDAQTVLDLVITLAVIQFSLTLVAMTVDLFIVFRIVWFGMLRSIPKDAKMSARQAFRYVGKALARFAAEEKHREDLLAGRK
jgi:hypothetical protein